jgi:hypothetical protein
MMLLTAKATVPGSPAGAHQEPLYHDGTGIAHPLSVGRQMLAIQPSFCCQAVAALHLLLCFDDQFMQRPMDLHAVLQSFLEAGSSKLELLQG